METKIQFLKPEAKPRYISFKIKLIDFSKVHDMFWLSFIIIYQ